MTVRAQRELEVSREKLRLLQERVQVLRQQPAPDAAVAANEET